MISRLSLSLSLSLSRVCIYIYIYISHISLSLIPIPRSLIYLPLSMSLAYACYLSHTRIYLALWPRTKLCTPQSISSFWTYSVLRVVAVAPSGVGCCERANACACARYTHAFAHYTRTHVRASLDSKRSLPPLLSLLYYCPTSPMTELPLCSTRSMQNSVCCGCTKYTGDVTLWRDVKQVPDVGCGGFMNFFRIPGDTLGWEFEEFIC